MEKERMVEILKSCYRWGQDNGSNRSDKNFNDFLETSQAKEMLEQKEQPQSGIGALEFLTQKGWQRENSTLGGAFFDGLVALLEEYRSQGLAGVTDEDINEYSIRQIKDAFNKLLPNEGDSMPFDPNLVLAMRNCLRIGAEDMRDGKIK